MSGIETSVLARRWFEEVWRSGGEATVHELLHPQGVGHLEGTDVNGHDEFLSARAALLDAFPDMSIEVDDIISQGNQAAVRWSVTATHRGEGLGMPATQRSVSFRGITWLRFSEDQVVEGWDAWNQGQLVAALKQASLPATPSAA